MVPYFFEELAFLEGGRLTDISYTGDCFWPAELDDDLVIYGQFVQLSTGQHVNVEEDFLNSHLPYRRAAFGGLDPSDRPWLFVLQAVPWTVVSDVFGPDVDPVYIMGRALDAALAYNVDAQKGVAGEWSREDLLLIYKLHGIGRKRLRRWTTFELLRGLLAELTGVRLGEIVHGYPDCAFASKRHQCEHDVFNDALAAWTRRLAG
jgi:hypothetical protein